MLKLMLGLLDPLGGSVRLFGREPADARGLVGYVPQSPGPKKGFPLTVLELTLMGGVGGRSFGWSWSAAEKKRARRALERVEMLGMEKERVEELSGGQLQRAIVARALMSEPRLLLLDEPTASIDPHGKFCFYEFLAGLKGEITIVVVSHDLSVSAAAIDSVAVVNRRLVYSSEPRLSREMLSMVYGMHEHTCPMDEYMREISGLLPGLEKGK
jgi:zinc transport system ATP-binding protein